MENKLQTRGSTSQGSISRVVTAARNTLKIAEYKESDITELAKRLIGIGHAMGITKAPDKMQMDAMVAFLQNNYKDLSMQEISLAFELGHAGKLNIDATDYNSFDMPYLGKVLNAYREHRNQEIQADKRKAIPESTPVRSSAEQHYNWIKLWIRENSALPFSANWTKAFTHIKSIGKGPTDEEREEFRKGQRAILKGATRDTRELAQRTLNDPKLFTAHCCEAWAKKHFEI